MPFHEFACQPNTMFRNTIPDTRQGVSCDLITPQPVARHWNRYKNCSATVFSPSNHLRIVRPWKLDVISTSLSRQFWLEPIFYNSNTSNSLVLNGRMYSYLVSSDAAVFEDPLLWRHLDITSFARWFSLRLSATTLSQLQDSGTDRFSSIIFALLWRQFHVTFVGEVEIPVILHRGDESIALEWSPISLNRI